MSTPLTIKPVRTEADWAAARAIRQRVFVEEQACPPEEEWDAHDAPEARGRTCHHLLGLVDGEPVAVARWRAVVDEGKPAAKLERFAVRPEHRGSGLGRAMVAHALADARAAGFSRFVLHAQAHLEGLYAAFGFRRVGEGFEEAGIPHVKMVLTDLLG
ncbi:MAG TPA: GNAT family N-acetyltransferase [Rubricoccaceae bacterium]|nr:GNAT family N-acetyltransferase [Rubricoccaceae bacterium]